MTTTDWYLLCFAFGFVWSVGSLFLGSLRTHGHAHVHGHAHGGHFHHVSTGRHLGKTAYTASFTALDFLNVHSIAIFLAWFGGCGYLLSRHTGLAFLAVLFAAVLAGIGASVAVVSMLRFLASRERVLDPFDYEMIGAVGRVSSPIRQGGTGEIVFLQDGARRAASARSDEGKAVERGIEVVITRYEKGIAYVRSWDAFTERVADADQNLSRGDGEAPRT